MSVRGIAFVSRCARALAVTIVIATLAACVGPDRLEEALAEGNAARVRIILRRHPEMMNAAVPGRSDTPLTFAIRRRNVEMVRELLALGVDPNQPEYRNTWTPLMWAGRVDIVRALLEYGADVDGRGEDGGRNALMMAITALDEDVAMELLDQGADIHARERLSYTRDNVWYDFPDGGETALITAARDPAMMTVLQRLVAMGADINYVTAGHAPLTALWSAVQAANIEAARYLVEQGADPWPESGAHRGILNVTMGSISGTNQEMLEYLLDLGIDIDSRNEFGRTPLFTAVDLELTDTVRFLLERGADPNIPNYGGRTSLYMARLVDQNNGVEIGTITALLESNGAVHRSGWNDWSAEERERWQQPDHGEAE